MRLCKNCQKEIPKRKSVNIFCDSRCSALYNNVRKTKKVKFHGACPMCSNPIKQKFNKFCSAKCNGISMRKNSETRIESNSVTSWSIIRDYLLRKIGKCMKCSISKWQGKKLILQCDHIDGNRNNNVLSNARLLCPNCHSQTDTFCIRNRYKYFGDLPRTQTST